MCWQQAHPIPTSLCSNLSRLMHRSCCSHLPARSYGALGYETLYLKVQVG